MQKNHIIFVQKYVLPITNVPQQDSLLKRLLFISSAPHYNSTCRPVPRRPDVLASTSTGCVIALGSDADVWQWYATLPAYPALHLCTLQRAAVRLMAAWPNASARGLTGSSDWIFQK